jgi:hypothetical protein
MWGIYSFTLRSTGRYTSVLLLKFLFGFQEKRRREIFLFLRFMVVLISGKWGSRAKLRLAVALGLVQWSWEGYDFEGFCFRIFTFSQQTSGVFRSLSYAQRRMSSSFFFFFYFFFFSLRLRISCHCLLFWLELILVVTDSEFWGFGKFLNLYWIA